MPFKKVIRNKKQVEMDVNKLIPFGNFSFDLFKGKHLDDIIDAWNNYNTDDSDYSTELNHDLPDDISKELQDDLNNYPINDSDDFTGYESDPITVRPVADGKYEILRGHYRIAAARKLKRTTIPVLIEDDLTDEEALNLVSDTNPIGLALKYDIDITDEKYMESEGFIKYKDALVPVEDSFSIPLEEYIERFLLTDFDKYDLYESFYDMGNPYELTEELCEYNTIARIIILKEDHVTDIDGQLKNWENIKNDTYIEKEDQIIHFFTRKKGGCLEQLKKHLNIDLDSFNYETLRNKRERAKILYFIYTQRNWNNQGIQILELLGKPSMENIDHTSWGWETSNGKLIKKIKQSVGKEITLQLKINIEKGLLYIMDTWGEFMYSARDYMEYWSKHGYDFHDNITSLETLMSESFIPEKTTKLSFCSPTPLQILYLRLSQYEYLGEIKDLLKVYNFQADMEYNIPPEYIAEMTELETKILKKDDFDAYFSIENVQSIAHLVYLKPNISKDERRNIRESKQLVYNFFNLPYLTALYPNVFENITELHIISCLQVILLYKDKKFIYKFHGYEGTKGNRKNPGTPLVKFKKGEQLYDAYQVYLVNRVIDCSFANIGKNSLIKNYHELNKLCLETLEKILSSPTWEETYNMHLFYYNKLESHWP